MTWSEAFTIFVFLSYFPHRWKDLTSYKLLILRTYCQFSGRVWLAYDQAFRQHAVAMKLMDWSTMNGQLYNFHAAGASVHSGSGGSLSELPEPSGADSSQVICQSWNRGLVPRVSSPIVSALVRAPTVCQNAPVVSTKRHHMIANADLLLCPPCPCPPLKPGVSGCSFLFSCLFSALFLSALIAFSFSPCFLTFRHRITS